MPEEGFFSVPGEALPSLIFFNEWADLPHFKAIAGEAIAAANYSIIINAFQPIKTYLFAFKPAKQGVKSNSLLAWIQHRQNGWKRIKIRKQALIITAFVDAENI